MANTLKLRGGTTAEVAAASLAEREIMVDTTKDVIVVGPTKKEMAVGNGGTYTGNYTFTNDVVISGSFQFGSSINANNVRIQNVATPTGNSDASNKSYVDGLITSVQNTVLPGNVFSADNSIAITDNNPGVGDINLSLSDNSVSSAKIQDNAVTSAKFADGSVTSLKFGTASVTTAKIADQAVTTAKLAVSAVTSNRIAAGAVSSTKLADNGIAAIKLQSDSVTTDKIQDDAVTTAKISASAVGTTELSDDAVTTAKIADTSITTALIADDAVTAAKIEDSVLATHAAQVTACANSATAAATSAASALAAFDNFDDTYLGAKASDPSTDNDGDALTAGDLYFNTTTDVMKLYTGSGWVIAYVPGDAANITNAASGNLTSTNVQSSLQELQTDIDNTVSATTTNATNITTNTTNIATNATNIASNVTALGTKVPRTSATGSAELPVGTTLERDDPASAGMIRYNSTLGQFEGYGTAWGAIGGGGFDVLSAPPTSPTPQGGDVYWDDDEAIPYIYYDQGGGVANWIPLVPQQNPKTAEGGGTDEIFHENDQTVTTSYTIATGRNALSAGPITINTGATVTVSAGSTWVIV